MDGDTAVAGRMTRERARALVAAAEEEEEQPYAVLLERGSLEVGFYAPRLVDQQAPHDQDEVYIVMSGSGEFMNGGERHEFGPGDALFVPAGVEHCFLDFTSDLEVWVVFFGPRGGEGR